MVAKLIAATEVGATIGAGASINSTGLCEGVYTATILTTLDWIIFSDFSEISSVQAYTTATGVYATAYVDGTTKNKVFTTTTGATTYIIKGIKA